MRLPAGIHRRQRLLAALCAAGLLAACQATPPALVAADQGGGAAGLDVPVPGLRDIGDIQGRGLRSGRIGQQVSVQAIVVGAFASGLGGVFVQSERGDGDPATADGLFIEHVGDREPRLRPGDRIRASGRVTEQGSAGDSLTMLTDTVIEVIGHGPLAPTLVASPPVSVRDWERFEGMLLQVSAPLTVSGNDGLSAYGELAASFDGRLFQPTEQQAPGPAAAALAADNARRTLLLDDNMVSKNPPLWFLRDGLDDAHPLRAGSVLSKVTGVLDQRRGRYRLQLTAPLQIRQPPRPRAPAVAGDLRIAGLNLHNLFNGDGRGGGFPGERGAPSYELYQVQQRKLVAMVQALAPDVAALMEVENDGSGPNSTLAQFVAALNAAGPARDFRLIDAGPKLGDDAIRVAMIYRGDRVRPRRAAAALTGGPFAGRSRVPLAQAFRAGSGPEFVVVANHFKSKGCGREPDQATGDDADRGYGCWNAVRVQSASRLLQWLAGDPTRSGAAPRLILGDLNANAMEDPVRLIRAAGWQDAFALARVMPAYSFVFDGQAGRLDHALLDAAMAARLRGAAEWHNNSDEPERFDYLHDADGDPYRASDHDPILLGFQLQRL